MNTAPTEHQPQSLSCPQCLLSDQVYSVRAIYLDSSTRLKHGDELNQPELERLLVDLCPDVADHSARSHLIRMFAQVFAPPPSADFSTRGIHPDAGFSMYTVLLLLVMYPLSTTRHDFLPVTFGLLALSVLIYLIGRRWVVRRYRAWQEQAAALRSDAAANRWHEMHFCSRDEIVFHPVEGQHVPIEQFQAFLNTTSPSE